ncbi:hypothetical protein [Thermofilum sp.]|uniref:hypothetical protein n=1 Tax=Thermofilum sp. TaxID=1961369 RepID=UPI003170BD73
MSVARKLIEAEKDELLRVLNEIEDKHDVGKIVGEYCSTRSNALSTAIEKIVEENGSVSNLIGVITQFYQTGEYKSLYIVWLLATSPEYREKIADVLAPLLACEKLIAASTKQK